VKQGLRSNACAARIIAIFIANFLKGYDVVVQNTIMQKVVSHELLIEIVPPYLHDTKMLTLVEKSSFATKF
jgi:hypothetical protein